jgi:hypothetical protein
MVARHVDGAGEGPIEAGGPTKRGERDTRRIRDDSSETKG